MFILVRCKEIRITFVKVTWHGRGERSSSHLNKAKNLRIKLKPAIVSAINAKCTSLTRDFYPHRSWLAHELHPSQRPTTQTLGQRTLLVMNVPHNDSQRYACDLRSQFPSAVYCMHASVIARRSNSNEQRVRWHLASVLETLGPLLASHEKGTGSNTLTAPKSSRIKVDVPEDHQSKRVCPERYLLTDRQRQ